jgi:hypothetical protein
MSKDEDDEREHPLDNSIPFDGVQHISTEYTDDDEMYRKLFKDEGRFTGARTHLVSIDHGNPKAEPIYLISRAEYEEWHLLRKRARVGWRTRDLVVATLGSLLLSAIVFAAYTTLILEGFQTAWWMTAVRAVVMAVDGWFVFEVVHLIRRTQHRL